MVNKLKLLNSSTKKNDIIDKRDISIYLCGPTVYNDVHIGNIRPIIIYDVLHRFLLSKKMNVNFVHNITDIDDKIINKAIEEGVSEIEVSEKYFKSYKIILNELNILPINMPKVSENMNEIILYIQNLINNNFAYKIEDGIYFSLLNFEKEYGKVSNIDIKKLNIGSRIENNLSKKNENDFVLWKKTNIGITWDSPMGKGRPGWHTECCVLINKFISDQVDIHCGGVDLRFPHHENENIQNIATFNKPLAKTWSHVGHVMVLNEKMSKSLQNFILAKDLLNKSNGNAVRWLFYQVKYSKPFNYFDKMIIEAKKSIDKIERELNKSYSYLIINNAYSKNEEINEEINNILNNDLDLPNLITYIYDVIKLFSINISKKNYINLNENYNIVLNSLNILGIKFKNIHNDKNIKILKEWQEKLLEKNFMEADKLREKLIKIKLL